MSELWQSVRKNRRDSNSNFGSRSASFAEPSITEEDVPNEILPCDESTNINSPDSTEETETPSDSEPEVGKQKELSTEFPGETSQATEKPSVDSNADTPTTSKKIIENGHTKNSNEEREQEEHNEKKNSNHPTSTPNTNANTNTNHTGVGKLLSSEPTKSHGVRAHRSKTQPITHNSKEKSNSTSRRKHRGTRSPHDSRLHTQSPGKVRKKTKKRKKIDKQPENSSLTQTNESIEKNNQIDTLDEPMLRENVRKKKFRPTSQHIKHCRLLRCVKATENFSGKEGELTGVHVGDTITLKGEISEGWCEGTCNGNTGWFPITIANELAKEHKVTLALEVSLPEQLTSSNDKEKGVDNSSLLRNKEVISGSIERKLKSRPEISMLVDRNIVISSDNTPSEQLLKNIEQQKTEAVLTNLFAGRRPEPIFADANRTFDISEDEDCTPRKLGTDEEVSCTEADSDEDTVEEKALLLFETKPMKAVKMMIDNNIIKSSPEAIADFLYCNPRLSGKAVGEYLGESDTLNLAVLDAFIDKMNLTDTEFDQAMRKFLFVFYLPGEAQKIDRIMCAFAKKYFMQNSGESRTHGKIFKHQDSVYLLAFATIMLNTDLHSKNVKTKMTQEQFVTRTNDGSFPPVFLKDLYQRILEEEIRTKDDKFTRAAKRGYLYLEKKSRIGSRKKQIQYWFVLDPESNRLYAFKEKDEQKLMEEYKLDCLHMKKKQTPTADKNRRYPLQLEYKDHKPPELRLLARSQRLWVDWLTIFTEVLNPTQ